MIQSPAQADPMNPLVIPGAWQNPLLQLREEQVSSISHGKELGAPAAQTAPSRQIVLAHSPPVLQVVPPDPLQRLREFASSTQTYPVSHGHSSLREPTAPVAQRPLQMRPLAHWVTLVQGVPGPNLQVKLLPSQTRPSLQAAVVQGVRKVPVSTVVVKLSGTTGLEVETTIIVVSMKIDKSRKMTIPIIMPILRSLSIWRECQIIWLAYYSL